jgi:hypothetical protein
MRFSYTAYYCEENIWHLAGDPRIAGDAKQVVILTNPGRQCAVWAQRNAARAGGPVLWDYHVILLVRRGSTDLVYDLDSVLNAPSDALRYTDAALRPSLRVPAELQPWFRVIDAAAYRAGFSSDRSHMRRSDGSWSAPPPAWPPIEAPQGTPGRFTLAEALDLSSAAPGIILDLPAFLARVGGARAHGP